MRKQKYKIGDWVVLSLHEEEYTMQIDSFFEEDEVGLVDAGETMTFRGPLAKSEIRPWTIHDAKKGDVLYTPKGLGVEGIFLVGGWKQVDDTGKTLCSPVGYRVEDDEIVAGGLGALWWKGVIDPFLPATKEQRELLFSKMKKAGYKWNKDEQRLEQIYVRTNKIYISGPISGRDPNERREAFTEVELYLSRHGFKPVNPMNNGLPADAKTCDHMRKDLRLLNDCEYIYMMTGWNHSAGCWTEFHDALAMGLEVIFEQIGLKPIKFE